MPTQKAATGEEDISTVHYLEIIVDTRNNSLGNLGDKMPSLSQLKLNNSIIPSVRYVQTTKTQFYALTCATVIWARR